MLHAVATPDAAEDEHFHWSREAGDQLELRGGEFGGVIDLVPAALLLGGAGGEVGDVGEGAGEFVGKVGSVHGG